MEGTDIPSIAAGNYSVAHIFLAADGKTTLSSNPDARQQHANGPSRSHYDVIIVGAGAAGG